MTSISSTQSVASNWLTSSVSASQRSKSSTALTATLAAPPAIASSTSSNWLSEANTAIQLSYNSGGMLGALQNSKYANGSISGFLYNSQNDAYALMDIQQSAVQNAGQLYAQMAVANGQKVAQERAVKEAAILNPPAQTNFTPPAELPSIIFNNDGSSIDTTSNIMTLSNGTQIDITTGLQYVDPKSILQIGNGAYLDTNTNILHESNGTQVDATTGVTLSKTA